MAESIFKNFDLEASLNIDPLGLYGFDFHEITLFAANACSYDRKISHKNLTHLTNAKYIRLANITYDAFSIGYEEDFGESYSHIHEDYTQDWELFWDCVISGYIKSNDIENLVNAKQLAGMCVLMMLDSVISNMGTEFTLDDEVKVLRGYKYILIAHDFHLEFFGDGVNENSRAAANKRHNKEGGSREKRVAIRQIWDSGKYTSRDICAEQECAALEMSFSTARKALRNTAEPTTSLAPASKG